MKKKEINVKEFFLVFITRFIREEKIDATVASKNHFEDTNQCRPRVSQNGEQRTLQLIEYEPHVEYGQCQIVVRKEKYVFCSFFFISVFVIQVNHVF